MHVLFVDSWLPAPDQDASSARVVRLLSILDGLGADIVFAADDTPSHREHYSHAFDERTGDVEVVLGEARIHELIEDRGRDFDVIWISRHWAANRFLEEARRHAPASKIVFDTHDLKSLRALRTAKATGNAPLLRSALLSKRAEIAHTEMADHTLVVSDVEYGILSAECPTADVRLVPLVQESTPGPTGFGDRNGVAFIGNFTHHPNVGAAERIVNEILPGIRDEGIGAVMHVIGDHAPDWLAGSTTDDLVVHGHVSDIGALLDRVRLTVAPLPYGAGVKGKVLLSLGCGVPAVCSTIAAEGITDDADALVVADELDAIIAAIVSLHTDEARWLHYRRAGLELIERRFSEDVARAAVRDLLGRDLLGR